MYQQFRISEDVFISLRIIYIREYKTSFIFISVRLSIRQQRSQACFVCFSRKSVPTDFDQTLRNTGSYNRQQIIGRLIVLDVFKIISIFERFSSLAELTTILRQTTCV